MAVGLGLELRADEVMAFDMYFASICAMIFHPRSRMAYDLEECKGIAMEMILKRREVLCRQL